MNNFKMDKNTTGKILFALGAVFLLISTYIGVKYSGVWYDELYSKYLIQLPLNEATTLVFRDVHPFLYYIILWIFVKIFSIIGIGDAILVGRIVSLIPFYLLGILSFTKIRKNFGMLVAGIFFLCICSMPELMIYSVEIRMYSWGLFFVTTSLIYSYEIVKNQDNLKNWAILTVLTIASAYTHYFSAIASFMIYLLLLIYIVRKNRSLLKKWIASAVISILAFAPWVFVVMHQISNIAEEYWIAPIKADTIVSYLYYVLSPADIFIQANELKSPTILGTIFLLIFIYLVYKNRDKFAMAGLSVVIGVPLIGIIISLVFQPFYHCRYIIPALGCLWLAFAVMYSKVYDENKKIFTAILCFVLIIGAIGTVDFIHLQQEDQINTDLTVQSVSSAIGEGNVVFYNYFGPYVKISSYYAPNNTGIGFIGNASDILQGYYDPGIQGQIKNGAKVFFVTEKMDDSYKNTNLTFTKIDVKFFIKDDEFQIYEVTEKS